jgi:hypothetical protein
MSKVKTSNVRVKQGDGRVAELLVAVYNAVKNQDINLGDINIDLDDVENLLQGIGGSVETPGLLKPTDAVGSPLQGMFSVSVSNTGAANGVLLGQTIEPGETLEYSAKTGNTLGDITFDATGTQFTILTTKII